MAYQFFRISTSSPQAGTDELNKFISAHRVVNIEKNFHSDGADAFWSFCLQWQDTAEVTPSAKATAPQVDFKAVLSEAQFTVFSKLRVLRKEIGQTEGIPVYAVATNEQLAAMVRGPITSTAGLQKVPGFGEAKVARFGKNFIELIQKNLELLPTESDSTTKPS